MLVRVDHNVLKKGEIKDPERINRTIGTLYNIVERGGETYFDEPRRSSSEQRRKYSNQDMDSVEPIVRYLENRLYTIIYNPKNRFW